MGTKIIVRGADFSANAVSQSPNYVESLIGTSETLWDSAASSGSNGTYGVLVPNSGYVSGLRMKSNSNGTVKTTIRVYEKNGDLLRTYDVLPSMIKSGLHEYTFTSPVPVSANEVICISGASGAFTFYYSLSGGDYPVSTSNGSVPDSGWRIYPFDFILQTESE